MVLVWPSPDPNNLGDEGPAELPTERRLFENGRFFRPDGKGRFLFEPPRPIPETPDDDFPFLLLTGRGSAS